MPTKYSIEDAPAKSKYTIEDSAITTPPKSDAEPKLGWKDQIINFWRPLSQDDQKALLKNLGQYGGAAAIGGSNAALGAASGAASFLLHPLDSIYGTAQTAADALNQLFPDSGLNPKQKAAKQASLERLKSQWESIKSDPDFALGNLAGGILAAGNIEDAKTAAAKPFKGAKTALLERMRKGTQRMVGAGEKPIAAQVGKEAESAQAGYESAKEKSQKATESTLEEQAKTKQSRLETLKKNREAQRAHQAEVEKTREANKEALRKQGKIEPTQEKLKSASEELRARIETAREKALKIGNEKYSGVNESLNPLEADMDALENGHFDPETEERTGGLKAAQEKIKGSETEPPILKDFAKRIQRGEIISYKDLQGYYSELGKELSKGSLPGDVFAAYDTLHETIGEQMQRLAKSKGKGEALADSRNYWRRMKQTFGKPYNPTDAATSTLENSSPEFARQEEQANRLRLLGSFDPEIPKVDQGIQNLRQGAKSLGEPKPVREVVKQPPAAPEPKPLPEYGEPKGSVPYERPEVNTRTIREKLIDRWASGESQLSKFQVRSLVSGGFGAVAGAIFGGGEGAAVGSVAGTVLGPALISRLLELPSVREWITRPPAGELEALQKLPHADRLKLTDGLTKVVQQAQRQGIPVSSAILALTGAGSAGQHTRHLQEIRDRQLHPAQQ